ncbi:MAG: hypothetical protein SV862_15985, partial [Pseudomonadota bacterium]|nr:hypothetical protein [Pseudomonadota bacterium]
VMPTRNMRGGILGGRQGQDTHGRGPRSRESDPPREHLLLAKHHLGLLSGRSGLRECIKSLLGDAAAFCLPDVDAVSEEFRRVVRQLRGRLSKDLCRWSRTGKQNQGCDHPLVPHVPPVSISVRD